MREEEEEEEELRVDEEMEEQESVNPIDVSAKKSCPPPSLTRTISFVDRPPSSVMANNPSCSSRQLPTSSRTFSTAAPNVTYSAPAPHYRAPLCSTSSFQPPMQQLMPLVNSHTSYPAQSLSSRYLPFLQPATTTTAINPHQITTQTAASTARVVSLPQSSDELPFRKMACIHELRRLGHLQARNTGTGQAETPYLFYQHQADMMQGLLPLDRQQEQLAFQRLKTIFSQIDECQARLSIALGSGNGRDFVRDDRAKSRLNFIVNRMTAHVIDLKNVAAGLDAVINPNP